MDLIRDVLDKQLVDRHEKELGRVDGIVLDVRDGKPPRVASIEVGTVTLARRLHPRLGDWVAARERRWSPTQGKPFRIPWSKVRRVGINVQVDLEAEKTPVFACEQWLREHLIARIPGGG